MPATSSTQASNFLLRVEPGAKPLKGSATVQTGNYTVLMANFGTRGDSGAVQIVLSTGACPAVASVSLAESSAATNNRQVQRIETFR